MLLQGDTCIERWIGEQDGKGLSRQRTDYKDFYRWANWGNCEENNREVVKRQISSMSLSTIRRATNHEV